MNLATSRPLSEAELSRCRQVAAELARLGDAGAECWVNPQGRAVHGQVSRIGGKDADDAFFNALRRHSFIFSGYRLANLAGEHSPSWTDAMGEAFDPGATAPDWSVPAFRAYTRGLASPDIYAPPLIMGEIGYEIDGRCVNRDVVAYQERINLMRELGVLERLKHGTGVVVEIGAGYGALAYYLKRRFPGVTYVIVDLPPSLLFSGCYLAAALPEVPIRVLGPGGAGVLHGGVNLVSNVDLEQLSGLCVDVAINTLSFAEMPAATVAHYCGWLERNLGPDGVLFEQNFDNRHYGLENYSGPAEVIEGFLRCRAARSRGVHWGPVRVWVRRSALRKLAWRARASLRSAARRLRRALRGHDAARMTR
jgi:hypothetical protein